MININCCHLALVLAIANIVTLAIFAGYTVKLRERQFLLEKKNGAEEARLLTQQRQLNQLKAEIAKLKQKDHHDQR
jgi:cell division protein FtsL